MEKNKLSVWQSACIITGYGVGGGIMAMPYLAEKNGILMAMVILVLSFLANLIIQPYDCRYLNQKRRKITDS